MQTSKYLVYLLLVATVTLLSSVCFSQSQIMEMKDSIGLRSYGKGRGDTILIQLDSAFILNKKTFKLYQDTYKRVQAGNPQAKKMVEEYERLVALQDSMLKEKEVYYQGLKSSFDSLATGSNDFLKRTDVNITAINQSLSNATGQLNNIKVLLDDSLDKLKLVNKQKFKWAVGGFTVGIGVASLVFLIAK
ncbi:MAG: hypothetical protein JWR72_2664 [Flavisolibacter sp.]|jgi:hypothetical protein|nr:hypothetical protein [Flavisolibacter sp.]